MKTRENNLSEVRINRLRTQGHFDRSETELNDLAFGHRFAFKVCVSVLFIGVVTANVPLLYVMMVLAFLSVVLPYHSFDYLYNHVLSKWLNKPRVPKRSAQLKFSCTLATLMIGGTIYLFQNGMDIQAYVMGGTLLGVGSLVAFTDYCIPSLVYNAIVGKKSK